MSAAGAAGRLPIGDWRLPIAQMHCAGARPYLPSSHASVSPITSSVQATE